MYCTLVYNKEENCLYDTWDGNFGTQENFRNVIRKTAELIEQHKITKILSDQTKIEGSYDSSRKWIQDEIVPGTKKILRKHAFILPKNVFASLSAKDYIQKVDEYEIRVFNTVEEARKWIKAV